MNNQEDTKPKPSLQLLLKRKAELEERLDIGAAKIEEARRQGKDVREWEAYWVQVLMLQFEAVCDKIRDLQAGAGA